MSRTVVIHQPDFMPYLGFFHRFLHADAWVILDHVQFLSGSNSWHNRDKIKTANGVAWVTVAVAKCPQNTAINKVLLAESSWRRDNLNRIEYNYRKAPFFSEIMPRMEELYAFPCDRMMDFNLKSVEMLLGLLDIRIETVLASALDPVGKSNELLVDLLQKTGARRYLSGVGARAYFDPRPFAEAGIEVLWQDFAHPVYPQLHGEFVPYLSSIDLLFNCGIDRSRKILREI